MAEIGKALVFYLKYFPQMQRFYEDKKLPPNFKVHHDRELVVRKIHAVGDAAGADAARLLESCFEDVLERLAGAKVVQLRLGRRDSTERNWDLKVTVEPFRERRLSKTTRQIGVNLNRDGVTPWIWSRGGLAVEEGLRHMLGTHVDSFGSGRYGWSAGAVGLKTIPVPWASAEADFTLDAEDIIKKTKSVCAVFSPAFLRKFVNPLH